MNTTDWTQIASLAGPNSETFPEGEQVYLFCHVDRLSPPEGGDEKAEYLRQFRAEAETHGLRAEIRDTPAGFCLFVVVPTPEDDALDRYNELADQAAELVEQGDVEAAKAVLAEAEKVRS
jgi:hypothetical protein